MVVGESERGIDWRGVEVRKGLTEHGGNPDVSDLSLNARDTNWKEDCQFRKQLQWACNAG